MKSTKILKKGGDKNSNKWVSLIQIHYTHVWKNHNESPLYNEYTQTKRNDLAWCRWLTPVILPTWEAEIGRIEV
jgi:hypothetical protein